MNRGTLPAFVRDLLASPPHRGQGLNNWFFRAARVLHPFLPCEEIIDLLQAATYGEPLQPGEIKRAVERSAACAWKPGERSVREEYRPAHPKLDQQFREAVIGQEGVTLSELAATSPEAAANDAAPRTESIVDAIFPGNPLLLRRKERQRGCHAPEGNMARSSHAPPAHGAEPHEKHQGAHAGWPRVRAMPRQHRAAPFSGRRAGPRNP